MRYIISNLVVIIDVDILIVPVFNYLSTFISSKTNDYLPVLQAEPVEIITLWLDKNSYNLNPHRPE
jgi:hypothetical protein